MISEKEYLVNAVSSLAKQPSVDMLNSLIVIMKDMALIETKDISDTYHTIGELYHHRAILFAVICNTYDAYAWKSRLHHDGTMFPGMFIVGVTTPIGQYTYHYHPEYWDIFKITELPNAPEYDGHKPHDVGRLFSLL